MSNKIRVVDQSGRYIGHIRRETYEKRGWPRSFCSLSSGNNLHLHWESQRSLPQANHGSNVCNYLDNLYRDYCLSKGREEKQKAQDAAQNERLKEQERKRETSRLARLAKRRKLVERYLADRSEACVAHVVDLLWTKSDSELEQTVSDEQRLHPDLYSDIEAFEHVKLMALALANKFDRGAEADVESLLSQAHLFVFDDDAWWAAHDCLAPLEKLPYPVCLVEDVLLWNESDEVKALALSEGAQVETSRALLAFVVDSHPEEFFNQRDASSTDFTVPLEQLPGSIVKTVVARRSHHTATSAHNKTGRSPRPHTRRGHWRNQAYGEGLKLRKRIWISDTLVTPSGKKYQIDETSRVHFVKLAAPNSTGEDARLEE